MNRRRAVLVALGLGVLAMPMVTPAQAPKGVRRIGFLHLSSLADARQEAFRKGMRDLGYVEGKTIAIDWRSAEGKGERLSRLAEELVRLKPELIVAAQTQAIAAAQRATATIPIVFMATPDPVGSGFARSLARPGGNLTGFSTSAADIGPKQLELLKSAVPSLARVAFLVNPSNNASLLLRKIMETAAQKISLPLLPLDAQNQEGLESAFAEAKNWRAEGIIVAVDGFFIESRSVIARLGLRHGLPIMSTQRAHAVAGGMITYGPDVVDDYRRAARYVDLILKGAKPADLPIEQPTRFELVVNLKTAKALGITIPQSILARADEVIE